MPDRVEPQEPDERSTPSANAPTEADAPSPSPEPGFFPGKPSPGRTIVVMTESGCRVHAIDGPIPARHLEFVAGTVGSSGRRNVTLGGRATSGRLSRAGDHRAISAPPTSRETADVAVQLWLTA